MFALFLYKPAKQVDTRERAGLRTMCQQGAATAKWLNKSSAENGRRRQQGHISLFKPGKENVSQVCMTEDSDIALKFNHLLMNVEKVARKPMAR